MRHILSALFVFLLISSFSFAETQFYNRVCGDSGTFTGSFFAQSWLSNIGIAFLISIMILVFIYLAGIALQKPAWNGLIRLELFELFMTAIIFGVMITLVAEMCSITAGQIYPEIPAEVRDFSLFSLSSGESYGDFQGGLYSRLSLSIKSWMLVNYAVNIWADQMSAVTVYARPLGVGMVTSPLSGIGVPLKQLLYNSTVALSIMYIMNAAQQHVIQFATLAFLQFYLPIGIFLRSFTPTRRLGGTLIALAISFILVLPLLNFASYLILFSQDGTVLNTVDAIGRLFNTGVYAQDKSLGDILGNVFSNANPFAVGAGFILARMLGVPNGAIVGILGGVFFGTDIFGDVLLTLILIPMSTIGIAALAALLSAMNIMLLVQTTKYLSKSLGEEIDVTSLTRMI